MSDPKSDPPAETISDLRSSFFYGSRSNLNVKFARDLSDAEFGDFLAELFDALGGAMDTGDASEMTDVTFRWQAKAYKNHLGDPADFRFKYDDVPFTAMTKPLAECRLLLLTSSGHFVDGDDPEPLGVKDMSQEEAEARITEFVKVEPNLSRIPIDTPPDRLRVLHGGYPVQTSIADNQVVLPLEHLRTLTSEGVIGDLVEDAYSFVGAAAQGAMRSKTGPAWAEMAKDLDADAVLLVPI
ncbi:MAG: glycine/sarcosine/betaine reductase selenoprotein B family protein [Acidimicrobiales bacterium]